MICFAVAPSIGVVYLVTETGNWTLTDLQSTYRAQTWSLGIFFDARKIGGVYFAVAPSKGVAHLVTETIKWALTELGST